MPDPPGTTEETWRPDAVGPTNETQVPRAAGTKLFLSELCAGVSQEHPRCAHMGDHSSSVGEALRLEELLVESLPTSASSTPEGQHTLQMLLYNSSGTGLKSKIS